MEPRLPGTGSGWSPGPCLDPTTVFVVTISFIRSFQVFDTVEAFYPQGGGPSKSVYVMMFAIYEKGDPAKPDRVLARPRSTVVFLAFVHVRSR